MKKNIFIIAALSLLLWGCKSGWNEPEQEPTVQEEPMTLAHAKQLYFISPAAFIGSFTECDNALSNSSSDSSWPMTITVDYGNESRMGADGQEHTGSIALHATAPWQQENAVITPSFVLYTVHGRPMTGKQVITFTGTNEQGNRVYDVTVENGLIGQQTKLIYSEHTSREITAAHAYSITGTMHAESKLDSIPGYSLTIDETAPLIVTMGDVYPMQGKMQINLDKPLSYTWDGWTGKYKSIALEFTGKKGNQYSAKADVVFTLGFISQNFTFTLLLDEDGIVPNSLVAL